jgi:AraC family transcriptional regulator
MSTSPDRLRAFVDLVIESVDQTGGAAVAAQQAYVSRFHFDRLFKAALQESPAAFRRRLLLERASWQLRESDVSATEAAFTAGYGSFEAFTRAFERAFGSPPSVHRRLGGAGFRLQAPNGVHFHPPGGLIVPAHRRGGTDMDLTQRLVEHDLWLTGRILDRVRALSNDELDDTVPLDHELQPYEADAPTIRAMLERLVRTKEIWTAAYRGRELVAANERSIDSLRRRFDESGREFAEIVLEIQRRDAWDTAFVDALCEPPASFTAGAMVAHVLTFSAYRRQQLLIALQRHGIDDLGSGDPIAWERSRDA